MLRSRRLATIAARRAGAARRGNSTVSALDQLHEENMALRRENEQLRQETSHFAGAQSAYTPALHFWDPQVESPPLPMPCFRVMDDLGCVVEGAEQHVPSLSREEALAMMTTMVHVSEFDKIYNDAQRQGRISFYMTSRGEEAASVGSAAALQPSDMVLPQYRELGVFFWRGLGFDEVANQLCSNALDPAHGRQLPLHIGSAKLNIVYIKSTLGTQCPHAAGVAYAFKQGKEEKVAVAYLGEGSASEGDFPSALNISAVHGCPAIFFCRNNGYAISTGTKDQYAGDGIAPRGTAYGLPTIRIDGNDALAVIVATRRARQIALEEQRPVLIEAMTYRLGAHSTSDDDSKYRNAVAPEEGWDSERAYWEARSPIVRFGRYLHSLGWWNPQMEDDLRKASRGQAVEALNKASDMARSPVGKLFSDVYDELPWGLREQQDALLKHMQDYEDHYQEHFR